MSNNYDYNIIDISNANRGSKNKKYFCNYCNRSLFLRDRDTQEYVCTNCTIIYYPNNQLVKKANRFDNPGPHTNEQGVITGDTIPPIAVIDNPNSELSSTTYKQQKLSPTFQALQRQGYRITSYEER